MTDRVTEYARDVVAGRIPAGSLHRMACQRHLDDLARQRTDAFPYYWNADKATEIIDYAETLTIAEGTEPKPVRLLSSQAFDIGCTFGWFKTTNGMRRFRRRYKSMARQNGKTFENGIIGTYIAGFGGYNYGKLFTVATKKRQARLAWEEMAKFVSIDPDLEYDKVKNPHGFFEVKEYKSEIDAVKTHCTIQALSRDEGLDDGFRSIFTSIDELHQHKDNKIYKALYNGTRALPETLVSMITTRGDNLNSFCKEMDDYAIKVLQGASTAEDFFVDIYTLDPGDDIWDPDNWIKANPFMASDAEKMETLKTDAQTAKDMQGSDLRDFLTKSLNMWVQNANDVFIPADQLDRCGSERTLEDFRGKTCSVGLDLSSGGDLTTYTLEFPEEYVGENGTQKTRFYFYSHSFMPRGRLQEHIETDLAPYDLWVQKELITVTGGESDFKNDYKFIIKDLKRLRDEYDLKFIGIGIDPHNADGVLADLEELGCPVVIVVQSARSLNDATVDLQLLAKSGDLEYNRNDELATWSILNARVVRNSFDEIKVDKKPGKKYKRIDPVDALVDAHSIYLTNKTEEQRDPAADLERYLEMMGWKK